jgi:hypothetical protein
MTQQKGGRLGAILIVATLVSCGTSAGKKCDIQCPNGVDTNDSSGCTCLPDDGGPADVTCGDSDNFSATITTNGLLCHSRPSADASADAGGE